MPWRKKAKNGTNAAATSPASDEMRKKNAMTAQVMGQRVTATQAAHQAIRRLCAAGARDVRAPLAGSQVSW